MDIIRLSNEIPWASTGQVMICLALEKKENPVTRTGLLQSETLIHLLLQGGGFSMCQCSRTPGWQPWDQLPPGPSGQQQHCGIHVCHNTAANNLSQAFP